ncbi:MAG: MarR family transcriptional regulator [Coriobacteriia bacterium]|nr:MarR family transcriptional regulator [Coriobacteriia bacterium]
MDESRVFDSLYRLMRLLRRFQGNSQQGHGHRRLSYSETRLLRLLLNHSGLSARELAELIDIRPPSLTAVLDSLEHKGDIVRIRDALDLRVWRISLTDQGRDEASKRLDEHNNTYQVIEDVFTAEESEIFCQLCEKLSSRLSEMAPAGKRRKG